MARSTQARHSPWPHRLAIALALVTFPLIWVGGLVTTYDAGMAVPDWPGTYGYNLLRYPWQTWLAGPWDLFIEHGHRLLGATGAVGRRPRGRGADHGSPAVALARFIRCFGLGHFSR